MSGREGFPLPPGPEAGRGPADEPILEVRGLSRRFGGLVAVNDVSFRVRRGEIVALIGPNGAGKTTLLNCVAGALPPSDGVVIFAGREITGLPANAVCRLGLSRTFQIPRPFPRMTVVENVAVAALFGGREAGLAAARRRALEVLDTVEFPRPPETPASQLNTLQLKRLDLARALASRPSLVLLDELAAGLTPGELVDLIRLLRNLREGGLTIVLVEHVMRLILDVSDRIVVLHYGRKIAEGSPDVVAADPAVREAYLGRQYLL
jgi:branched-chain amino acid transport system ATP-binding protein